MKKFAKNIMAAFMASSCLVSACALNSNALSADSKVLSQTDEIPFHQFSFDKYTEFEPNDLFDWHGPEASRDTKYYTDGEKFYAIARKAAQITIYMPVEVDGVERFDIMGMLQNKYNIYDIHDMCTSDRPFLSSMIGDVSIIVIKDTSIEHKTIANINNILEDIKKMADVYYCGIMIEENTVGEIDLWGDDITDYPYLTNDEVEKLLNCVDELNLDVTAEVYDYDKNKGVHIIPNNEITWEEHLELAHKIKDSVGIAPMAAFWGTDTYSRSGFVLGGDTIEVTNCLYGDANEDGEVGMADAAAIIRHMGNPDEYALSPQGYFNADIDGDGLTGADAIEIQHKVAKAGMPQ